MISAPFSALRACLACILCLQLLPTQAFGESVNFGDDHVRYTLDVPEHWEFEQNSENVQLSTQDKKQSVSLSYLQNEHISLKSLQQVIPSLLGLSDVKKKETKGGIVITGVESGVRVTIELRKAREDYLLIISAGMEKKELDALLGGMKEEVKEEGAEGKEEKHEKDKEGA